jgi:hypothetical protein
VGNFHAACATARDMPGLTLREVILRQMGFELWM